MAVLDILFLPRRSDCIDCSLAAGWHSLCIEFLAEWLVTFLIPATHVLGVRAPHLSFMLLKEYSFRELYLGLKVTASFDRSESCTRVIDGQVRCITPEMKPEKLQVNMEC